MVQELFGHKPPSEFMRGLGNAIADTTAISWVNSGDDRLVYRGIDISELVTSSNFEEVAYLLICGSLPTQRQLNGFSWRLRQMQHAPDGMLRIIDELPSSVSPLLCLQTAIASLGAMQSGHHYTEQENLLENAMRCVAQTPVILAATYRHILGVPFVSPREDISHTENFMYMLTGRLPSPRDASAMEKALIVQMDNGFTSATFAARVVASTMADVYSSVVAAVAALSGSMVGGACHAVFELLRECRESHDIASFVQSRFSPEVLPPGFSHRVFMASDPRAKIMEDVLFDLCGGDNSHPVLQFMRAFEKEVVSVCSSKRAVFSNVDFWIGAVYQVLGLHPVLLSATAAVAKIVGWVAHIIELRQEHCLYRPRALYTGPTDVPYIAIADR